MLRETNKKGEVTTTTKNAIHKQALTDTCLPRSIFLTQFFGADVVSVVAGPLKRSPDDPEGM